MTQYQTQKYPWLTNVVLAAGIASAAVFGLAGDAHAAASSAAKNETGTAEIETVTTRERSVSVTASVALSDYFAQLVATLSTVEARVTAEQTVELAIQIRSDEQFVFPKHPLVIEITQVATGILISKLSGVTDREGRFIHTLDASTWPPGFFRIAVIDQAYRRPIALVTQPTIYLAVEADGAPSALAPATPAAGSAALASIRNADWSLISAAGQYPTVDVPQFRREFSRHHYPAGHDP